MALNPGIALQAQVPQFENRLSQLAQMEQLGAMQDRRRMTDMQLAAAEREASENRLLSEAVRESGGDLDAAAQTAIGRGAVRGGLGLQKSAAEARESKLKAQKLSTEDEKARLETNLMRVNATAQILASASDQASYDAARQQLAALPGGAEAVQRMPPQFNPTFIAQTVQQGMTLAQRMEQDWKAKGFDLDREKFGYQQRNDAANRAVTMRGQDKMVEAAAAAGSYQQGPNGNMLFVPTRAPTADPNAPIVARQVVDASGAPVRQGRELPADIQKAARENAATLSQIDSAIAEVTANPGALGLVNAVPGAEIITQYTDRKGVPARAAVADIGSKQINDRSGAAVTISEYPRLAPFVPKASDHPDVALAKMRKLREKIAEEQQLFMSAYGPEQGYRATPLIPSQGQLPASTQGGAVPPASNASTGGPAINPNDPLGLFGNQGR